MKILTPEAMEDIASKYAGRELNSFGLVEESMDFGFSENDSLKVYFKPESFKYVFYAPENGKNRSMLYEIDGRDYAPIFPDGTKGYGYEDFPENQKTPLDYSAIEKEMKKYPFKGMFFKIKGLEDAVTALFSGRGREFSGFIFTFDQGGITGVEYRASGTSRRYGRKGENLIEVEAPRIKMHLGHAIWS